MFVNLCVVVYVCLLVSVYLCLFVCFGLLDVDVCCQQVPLSGVGGVAATMKVLSALVEWEVVLALLRTSGL